MTSALELRQVSKVYGSGPSEVRALGAVDLSVERGELVAVMGPSDSGKSTLLTIAGSLEEPSSGQVLVDGVDLATVSRADQATMRRRAIGYVFQDFNLLPGLTAVENVALPLLLGAVGRHEAEARAAAWFGRLGLEGLERRRPGDMSGGEAQRVAVARALVSDPAIIFADEPTGSLDSLAGEQVMELLTGAARDAGTSVVVVTHEARVAAYADREVFVRDGRLAGTGLA